jgi:hypothetical protein
MNFAGTVDRHGTVFLFNYYPSSFRYKISVEIVFQSAVDVSSTFQLL